MKVTCRAPTLNSFLSSDYGRIINIFSRCAVARTVIADSTFRHRYVPKSGNLRIAGHRASEAIFCSHARLVDRARRASNALTSARAPSFALLLEIAKALRQGAHRAPVQPPSRAPRSWSACRAPGPSPGRPRRRWRRAARRATAPSRRTRRPRPSSPASPGARPRAVRAAAPADDHVGRVAHVALADDELARLEGLRGRCSPPRRKPRTACCSSTTRLVAIFWIGARSPCR